MIPIVAGLEPAVVDPDVVDAGLVFEKIAPGFMGAVVSLWSDVSIVATLCGSRVATELAVRLP